MAAQNGHFGNMNGPNAMNGEIPSVPITTLAGIASLTDLLPELPVPGPMPHGNPNPGSNLLYHRSLVEEANQLLANPSEALANQVSNLLNSTNVDFLELNEKNTAAVAAAGNAGPALPRNNLMNALYQRSPSIFGTQQQQAHPQQQQWSNQQQQQHNNFQQDGGNSYGHASPATTANNSGYNANYVQQQQQGYPQQQQPEQQANNSYTNSSYQQQPQQNQAYQQQLQQQQQQHAPQQQQTVQASSEQSSQQQESEAKLEPKEEPKVLDNNLSQQPHQVADGGGAAVEDDSKAKASSLRLVRPVLRLKKLSDEAGEALSKSVKEYKRNTDETEREQGGVYDSPRSSSSRRAAARRRFSDEDMDDIMDDSEDEDTDKKGKSKFFKATEKEREEERRKEREERRKRRHDGGDAMDALFGKRRRTANRDSEPSPPRTPEPFVPKKATRKIERKLLPVLKMLNADELVGDNNTFKQFNKTVDLIFENMEDINLDNFNTDDAGEAGPEIPPEVLIPKYQLHDLAAETAKLKSLGVMESVSSDRLIKLLNILELNIRDGSKVIPLPNDDEDEDDDKMFLEMAMERVSRGADASIAVLNILTSRNMSKTVYIDDVIDRVALFLRFHLANTIYPSYDPVYKAMSKSKTGYMGSMKKKRTHATGSRDRNIIALYNKTHELTSMMANLVKMQTLTDTTILHISTLGVAPFFVENIPELQLAALKLVTNLFSKYENHRKLLLDDILASIARLPSSKRSLRTYRLNGTTHIQMLTALVLQLIQCVVCLPKKLAVQVKEGKTAASRADNTAAAAASASVVDPDGASVGEDAMDREVLINHKYQMAMGTAHQFLSVFLKKCGSKNEDIDYRPLFENFVQDLLTTVNTPEWPAAELLLSLLGRVLREKFRDRSTEMALRISSLEYLGVVAARLRKDAVQSKMKVDYIDSIIESVKQEEEKEGGANTNENASSETKKKKKHELEDDPEDARSKFLQRVLLDYLAVNGEEDQATMNARHFYICQWYRDVNVMGKKPKKPKRPKKAGRRGHETSSSESEESEDDEPEEATNSELYRFKEARKDFLIMKIPPFGISKGNKGQVLSTHIHPESAHLIVKYLSSKRPFFNSFNYYLKDIINVLNEQSTQVRTKALKCMAMIVTEDPDVLLRSEMKLGVDKSFTDLSTMVREAAVDLVGKFILHKQELITEYYSTIMGRILDTGVSVRKRVIKILKDICLEYPSYDRIPEMCVKMIRRINDEEGIRKLVMDVFLNMWFVPFPKNRSEEEEKLLVTRCMNITDVVVACKDTGLEWFEQLLQTLFKPREDKEDATKKNEQPMYQMAEACQQIVDCLVESVLHIEETSFKERQMNPDGTASTIGTSNRIVACLSTLYLFSKIRPQLLVNHVQTLQPYLQVQGKTAGDKQIISSVALTMEMAVPLIKHPSEIFLSQLEEDSVKLILKVPEKKVVAACISCLGSVVNNVTKNYNLIRDCFKGYYNFMTKYRNAFNGNQNDQFLIARMPMFRRSMFTVSLLLRHFDFEKEDIYTGLPSGRDTVLDVFYTTFSFIMHPSQDVQSDTLYALGSICIRHYNFMLESKLKNLYIDILMESFYSDQHKKQVLNNLENYLAEEEIRMRKQDEHWQEYSTRENLKEMGDVTSGMASTVIQVYLKAILDSFLHDNVLVRHAALRCISLILAQGLVHPVHIVPYLVCMSTDSEKVVSHSADRELQEIEKKYPGFIHMKLQHGIHLSYDLQQLIMTKKFGDSDQPIIVRGYRTRAEGELPSALNGFLYSIMKTTKPQRRSILKNFLKEFEDNSKSTLGMMLYLADNLAYIPYTVIDEPLYVIHQIDIMISVTGSNLLQTFKENLRPPPSAEARLNLETGKTDYIYDEDLDDEFDSVLSRLPEDCTPLQEAITASQGCMLLLVLKEHLKDFYGFTAAKIQQYSPNDTSKATERQVNRRGNVRFEPKATIEILKQGVPDDMTDEHRRQLVTRFLEFKELMNKIDPEDEEEDEDGNPMAGSGANTPSKAGQYPTTPVKNTRSTGSNKYSNHGQTAPQQQQLPPASQQQQQFSHPYQQLMYQRQQQQGYPQPQQQQHSHHEASISQPSEAMMQAGAGAENLELDPETGMMVERPTASEENNYVRMSAQDTSNLIVPKLTINLGAKVKAKHHHHKDHHRDRDRDGHGKHKKKKKDRT